MPSSRDKDEWRSFASLFVFSPLPFSWLVTLSKSNVFQSVDRIRTFSAMIDL